MRLLMFTVLLAGPGVAEPFAIEAAARHSFDDMPVVELVEDVSQLCGAQGLANRDAIYCTSPNVIYLRRGAAHLSYKVAHLMGHAVQVRHGIADFALREVRARPAQEGALRGMVTRQVECLAGFLHQKAGIAPLRLMDLDGEPFTGSHWGRTPLRIGPQVSIGLSVRADWLMRGYEAESLAECAAGEIGADLLLEAYKG